MIATVASDAIFVVAVKKFDTPLGVDPHSALRWLFPPRMPPPVAFGLVWALVVRRSASQI
ncbi:hypothetical protein Q3V37_17460 [Micromonospora profundi]|uniref:Uncharacterized protein n=1 Tax=Micromonospora profundi TaxID=1420889 RepID=A0AAJ6HSS4_9ACTN|nr:hypothetical protein [Micromonospora profundi]WLS43209.1 hypothetical protein Q3V37_17460 [Micromonospora profundi]